MYSEELCYFVPGQVILHLEYDEMVDINQEVISFLSNSDELWNQLILRDEVSTITFPRLPQNKFSISLVPTLVREQGPDLVDLLIKMYAALGENGFYLPNSQIRLRTVSPNWLMSASQAPHGLGGPATWPVRAIPPGDNFGRFGFDFSKSGSSVELSKGENVEVAVLDTAPITNWHTTLMENSVNLSGWPQSADLDHNALYNDLKNKLSIVNFDPIWEDFSYSLMYHDYLMPDHGLFIAGIIHTIAPNATLHLYEVLNPHGIGCYEMILAGLQKALTQCHRPLIINCSFYMDIPRLKAQSASTVFEWDSPAPGLSDKFKNPFLIQQLTTSFLLVVDQIQDMDVFVVAAAGNDAKNGSRPGARYPAACSGVIGVGAVPVVGMEEGSNLYNAASYSNLCDTSPFSEGCMTLGGEKGLWNGLRGVFIHRFPVQQGSTVTYDINDTGWAWWAGTSFATSIISGFLAAAFKTNNLHSVDDVKQLLSLSSGGTTVNGERVIVVTQPLDIPLPHIP